MALEKLDPFVIATENENALKAHNVPFLINVPQAACCRQRFSCNQLLINRKIKKKTILLSHSQIWSVIPIKMPLTLHRGRLCWWCLLVRVIDTRNFESYRCSAKHCGFTFTTATISSEAPKNQFHPTSQQSVIIPRKRTGKFMLASQPSPGRHFLMIHAHPPGTTSYAKRNWVIHMPLCRYLHELGAIKVYNL